MQSEFSIVILAHRRLYSLQRLLYSLVMSGKAYNSTQAIPIIISLDEGADESVVSFCKNFFSRYFEITIILQEKKLGVDGHNLWAMAQSEKEGTVMVLEDDTMVSPSLFFYATQALRFYKNDVAIAGISLYNYQRNEACGYPFYKVSDGTDTYFYQKASSRGLLITKQQWHLFKSFKPSEKESELPEPYRVWSDQVWEKSFHYYLCESGNYWVHPQLSLTTNFGEIGTHVKNERHRHAFQSVMQQGVQTRYEFKKLEDSSSVYDSYGEAVIISGFKKGEITADIFGCRDLHKIKTKYLLTSRNCSIATESYALDLVPAELNIKHHLSGNDLKVTEAKYVKENYWQRTRRQLKLHYYFYPDKGLLPLLRLKVMEIISRID